MKTCSVEGCGKKYHAKGLCSNHASEAWRQAHRLERKAYEKVYRETHRELKNAIQRRHTLKVGSAAVRAGIRRRKYGLLPEAEKAMLEAQAGTCAICKLPPSGNRKKVLSVDHDHKTGEIRGLLCDPCNRALGYMKDEPSRMRAAAEYLEKRRV